MNILKNKRAQERKNHVFCKKISRMKFKLYMISLIHFQITFCNKDFGIPIAVKLNSSPFPKRLSYF